MKSLVVLVSMMVITFSYHVKAQSVNQLEGAWENVHGDNRMVMICSEKYFAAAVYNKNNGAFVGTCGGQYSIRDNTFVETHEFNTMDPSLIGVEKKSAI